MTVPRPGPTALILLGVSGLMGFRLGMVVFPTWHVAVETGQVLAGLVHYPPGNPFYIYHTKLWTILHHICALLLRAGLSEISVSMLLSGLLGMISLQALTMFVYALSGNVALALGGPLLMLVTRVAEHGVAYPIWLMGTSHTYGAVGLSLIVLVPALFGAGMYRMAGLLLGLAPSVHPSLGAWLWFLVLIACLFDWRAATTEFRSAVPFFVAGCLITAASLAVQLLWVYDVPHVDPAEKAAYLKAFTQFWDAHRQPVDARHEGVAFNRDALLLAAVWLLLFRRRLSPPASFLLRVVAVSGAVSALFVPLSWVPPDRVPSWLLLLMPARLLNFNVMVFGALLFGLAGGLANRTAGVLIAGLIALVLLVSQPSMLWDQVLHQERLSWLTPLHQARVLELAAIGLVAYAVLEWRRGRRSSPERVDHGYGTWVTRWAAVAVFIIVAVAPWPVRRQLPALDRTNNVLFKIASEDPDDGLLATGSSYSLIQLRTRRPVLLDSGALDTLSYAPESGPEMARILKDVYDIDLLHPPRGLAPGGAAIPADHNKRVWESFTRERWQEIKRTYRVTQVLTSADETLQLPVAAQFASFRLYRIPD